MLLECVYLHTFPCTSKLYAAANWNTQARRTAFGSGQFRRERATLLIFAPIRDAASDGPHRKDMKII